MIVRIKQYSMVQPGERHLLPGRWILVNAKNGTLAWSGARWVPIGGDVQISNFESHADASAYAASFGFEVLDQTGSLGLG